MPNRSILPSLSLVAATAVVSTSCKRAVPGAETTTLRYLGAAGTVSLPELAEDLGYLGPVHLEYKGSTFSGPEDIQEVVSKDVDFGSAFSGAIVKLAASGSPVRAVVASYGVDSATRTGYFVLENSPLRKPSDLLGRKIAMNTLGAHHEFMVREWLRRGGLDESAIKKVVLVPVPPINGEELLRSGQVDVSALGTILRDRALVKGGIRPLFFDHDLYGDFTAGSYIFRREFTEKNPNTVRIFATGVAKALEWSRSQPRDTVIARFRAIVAKRKRNENDAILKYWKSYGITAKHGLQQDRDYQIWIDFLAREGTLAQGAVKPSDIYTNAFNDYRDSLR